MVAETMALLQARHFACVNAFALTLAGTITPAWAQSSVDCIYRSAPASGNQQCGTTRFDYPLPVKDGTASLQTVSLGLLEGPVKSDGSVVLQAGTDELAGRITHFSGAFTNRNCVFNTAFGKG